MLAPLFMRLFLAIPGVVLVVSLVFLLVRLVPGDPVSALLGDQATLVDMAAMRAALELDVPWWEQLMTGWAGILHGDLGESLVQGRAVTAMLAERAMPTLILGAAAMSIAVAVGLVGGVVMAAGGARRQASLETVFVALMAVPTFVLGPLLMMVFSVKLGWLPVSGFDSLGSVVLPAITLGVGLGCALARMLGGSLRDQAFADYVRTVRAKGGSRRLRLMHILRNALIPTVVLLCLQLGMVLTGVVLTEAVFGWPGVGTLLVEGLQGRDYPLVQGVMLVIAVGYVLANTLADVLVRILDPRSGRAA